MKRFFSMGILLAVLLGAIAAANHASAALRAGAAKVDITDPASPVRDGALYAKALVLNEGETTAVVLTVDAVAIGEIGPIRNDFLAKVRLQIEKELNIKPGCVLVNASHCHGRVCKEVDQRAVQAVKEAKQNMVPVTVGGGRGFEDRIMENRRLRLGNGREADVRHAYSLPPDQKVIGIGPVDPDIGVLRLDKADGQPLAVVYNFACHPIQGIPSGENTGDLTGFACRVIEDNLGPGTVALFLQGCAGDINPVCYKDVDHPRDAEQLGNLLGLSTLKACRKIQSHDAAPLRVLNESIELPRADLRPRIASLQAEQTRLVRSLKGTSLNLKTFVPLFVKYSVSPEHPSYYSHAYLHDQSIGRHDWSKLDAENRRNMERYIANIHVMEELTRVQANLAILEKHQAQNVAAGQKMIDVEVLGLRVGDFVLVTFPGELSAQIGLNIKKTSSHPLTFVAAYTNGYIYYAPTEEQLRNPGCAQEDCDCLLAPGWQRRFETHVTEMLKRL